MKIRNLVPFRLLACKLDAQFVFRNLIISWRIEMLSGATRHHHLGLQTKINTGTSVPTVSVLSQGTSYEKGKYGWDMNLVL